MKVVASSIITEHCPELISCKHFLWHVAACYVRGVPVSLIKHAWPAGTGGVAAQQATGGALWRRPESFENGITRQGLCHPHPNSRKLSSKAWQVCSIALLLATHGYSQSSSLE